MRKIIDDVIIKSDRTDRQTKERICQGYSYKENGNTIFVLEQTKRWFDMDKFNLSAGYTVTSGSTTYRIDSVSFEPKRPKRAVLQTTKISYSCKGA